MARANGAFSPWNDPVIIVGTAQDLEAHVGAPPGTSDWEEITQDQIDRFAELSGDDHWIHVDVARAAREQPDGKTIAHGLFLLSLIPRWQRQIFRIERRGAGLSYGYDRVRFTAPVPVGSRVRLSQAIVAVSRRGAATQLALSSTVEMFGADRPALVADGLLLIQDAPAAGRAAA